MVKPQDERFDLLDYDFVDLVCLEALEYGAVDAALNVVPFVLSDDLSTLIYLTPFRADLLVTHVFYSS